LSSGSFYLYFHSSHHFIPIQCMKCHSCGFNNYDIIHF